MDDPTKGQKLAHDGLEGTLPWTVKIQFLGKNGESVFDWEPGYVLTSWDDRVTLNFSPSDMSMEIRPVS